MQLARHTEISNDAGLLLAAGTPTGWGVALVSGTGSIAFGRSPDGRTDRAGGWGYILGDEGSAYGIVTAALRASARAADLRGAKTALLERFLDKLQLAKASDLIPAIYGGSWDRARLATLAPLVMEAAAVDPIARQIIDDAAHELALAVATVAKKLNLDAARLPLAVTGGVIIANASFRQQIVADLAKLGCEADPVCTVREPAEGAIRIASGKLVVQG
jgi:N-acetylmuramic acid 6-phosphate etherase